MRKWKLITGIVLIFLLGTLIGSLGTGLFFKYRFPSPREPKEVKMTVMKHLVRQLDLTAEQKPGIEAIVDQLQEKTRDHFRQTREEMKAIIDQGIARIKKELNPDQQKKLDELRKRFDQQHHRWEEPGPPPPDEFGHRPPPPRPED